MNTSQRPDRLASTDSRFLSLGVLLVAAGGSLVVQFYSRGDVVGALGFALLVVAGLLVFGIGLSPTAD